MGMGAHASAPARRSPEQRSELANTLPQPCEKITKRTLRESIPAHCFKRSYAHSFCALGWDCLMVGVAFWAVHAACAVLPGWASPVAWLAYAWYQGLTFTGLWVIAHECGHGGFTDSRLVNDAVGFVLHSSLVTPYFSWAITHAKHHHYTNHMTMGETWVPSTADPTKQSVQAAKSNGGTAKRIAIVALVRATRQRHEPSRVQPCPREQPRPREHTGGEACAPRHARSIHSRAHPTSLPPAPWLPGRSAGTRTCSST